MADILSEVLLLRAPLENDYKHTYYWEDLNEQASFFKRMKRFEAHDLTYVKHEEKIRWHQKYEEICDCNYVMYRNAPSQKWFYAFITKMVYVDEGRTDIYIERDVFQTWITQINVQYSFIEREHVNDDTIGLHTVPEQLETGDYIMQESHRCSYLYASGIVMATTVNLNADGFPNVAGGYYNGIYSGVKYYYMDGKKANQAIKALADAGKSDAIVSIFHVPVFQIDYDTTQTYYEIKTSNEAMKDTWIVSKPTTIDGYAPENNKLFTYPYRYLLLSNNSGGSAVFKYELFNEPSYPNQCHFNLYSCITPGFSTNIVPKHYNGVEENTSETLSMGKYPICSWNTDVYTNWLTQNSINIGTQLASAGLQVVGGGAAAIGGLFTGGLTTAAGIGSMMSGAMQISNTLGEVYAHSLQPAQAEGNLNNGDATFAAGHLSTYAYKMSIKSEFAKIIDQYFHAYGYKVNRIGVPLKKHRRQFWFTKTIDANIDCPAPMDDVRKIKAAYDRGITFWHNIIWEGGYVFPIGDYNVTNSIIN